MGAEAAPEKGNGVVGLEGMEAVVCTGRANLLVTVTRCPRKSARFTGTAGYSVRKPKAETAKALHLALRAEGHSPLSMISAISSLSRSSNFVIAAVRGRDFSTAEHQVKRKSRINVYDRCRLRA